MPKAEATSPAYGPDERPRFASDNGMPPRHNRTPRLGPGFFFCPGIFLVLIIIIPCNYPCNYQRLKSKTRRCVFVCIIKFWFKNLEKYPIIRVELQYNYSKLLAIRGKFRKMKINGIADVDYLTFL